MARGVLLCGCALALAAMAPSAAVADDTARQRRAGEEFARGEALFGEGNFDAAAERFQAAYDIFPDPVYLFNTALSYEKRQRWPLAIAWYQRYLDVAPDSAAAPEVWRRLEAAEIGRKAAQATLKIDTNPAGATARLLGGDGGRECTTPCALQVDPGPVTIEIQHGGLARRLAFSVSSGEVRRVGVSIDRGEGFAPVRTASGLRGPPTAGWVALGAGGAALINGVVFGLLAKGDHDDGKRLASRDGLSADDRARLASLRDDVKTRSLVADISFGVAAAGVVAGGLLWWLQGDDAPVSASFDGDVGVLRWRF